MAETDPALPSGLPPPPSELSTELSALIEICDVCANTVATSHTGNTACVTEKLDFEFCLFRFTLVACG